MVKLRVINYIADTLRKCGLMSVSIKMVRNCN